MPIGVTVTVGGTVMPWSPSLAGNPTFGQNDGAAPVVALANLVSGDKVEISAYGTVAASGARPAFDADGGGSIANGTDPNTPTADQLGSSSGNFYPTHYMANAALVGPKLALPLARAGWVIASVGQFNTTTFKTANAFDGDLTTNWDTGLVSTPRWVTIDRGAQVTPFSRLVFIPRTDGSRGGDPYSVELYVSTDGTTWGTPIATGTWLRDVGKKYLDFTSVANRYIKFQDTAGGQSLSIAELNLGDPPSSLGLCVGGLCGAFTDATGHVIQAIAIGFGPSWFTVPAGATQLQLGVNDEHFADNTGSFSVSAAAETATVISSSPFRSLSQTVIPVGTVSGGSQSGKGQLFPTGRT
jgi:hypothetical protein